MRISDWSSDVCSSDLVLVRHRLDDLFDGTPAERWLKLMRPFVPRAPRELAAQSRGARLRLALQELGPIFVKFGQILSTRRDLVPPDVADERSALQDRVATVDGDTARRTIQPSPRPAPADPHPDSDPPPPPSASTPHAP